MSEKMSSSSTVAIIDFLIYRQSIQQDYFERKKKKRASARSQNEGNGHLKRMLVFFFKFSSPFQEENRFWIAPFCLGFCGLCPPSSISALTQATVQVNDGRSSLSIHKNSERKRREKIIVADRKKKSRLRTKSWNFFHVLAVCRGGDRKWDIRIDGCHLLSSFFFFLEIKRGIMALKIVEDMCTHTHTYAIIAYTPPYGISWIDASYRNQYSLWKKTKQNKIKNLSEIRDPICCVRLIIIHFDFFFFFWKSGNGGNIFQKSSFLILKSILNFLFIFVLNFPFFNGRVDIFVHLLWLPFVWFCIWMLESIDGSKVATRAFTPISFFSAPPPPTTFFFKYIYLSPLTLRPSAQGSLDSRPPRRSVALASSAQPDLPRSSHRRVQSLSSVYYHTPQLTFILVVDDHPLFKKKSLTSCVKFIHVRLFYVNTHTKQNVLVFISFARLSFVS